MAIQIVITRQWDSKALSLDIEHVTTTTLPPVSAMLPRKQHKEVGMTERVEKIPSDCRNWIMCPSSSFKKICPCKKKASTAKNSPDVLAFSSEGRLLFF